MSSHVVGTPGAFARSLARSAAARCVAATGLGLLCLLLFFLVGSFSALGDSGLRSVSALSSVLGAGVCFMFAYEAHGRYQRAAVGARSEERVGRILDSLGATAVLHGALLGAGGDADHVVLGPCAVVVETKTGRGHVQVKGDAIVAGQRTIPGSPLRQAQRQARALKQTTHCWVDTVVCIPDMTNPPVRSPLGIVCSLDDLTEVISSLNRPLTPDAAARATSILSPDQVK